MSLRGKDMGSLMADAITAFSSLREGGLAYLSLPEAVSCVIGHLLPESPHDVLVASCFGFYDAEIGECWRL